MALLVATALSVYKPWGMTVYGRRSNNGVATRIGVQPTDGSEWTALWVLAFLIAITLFAWLHLVNGGLHH